MQDMTMNVYILFDQETSEKYWMDTQINNFVKHNENESLEKFDRELLTHFLMIKNNDVRINDSIDINRVYKYTEKEFQSNEIEKILKRFNQINNMFFDKLLILIVSYKDSSVKRYLTSKSQKFARQFCNDLTVEDDSIDYNKKPEADCKILENLKTENVRLDSHEIKCEQSEGSCEKLEIKNEEKTASEINILTDNDENSDSESKSSDYSRNSSESSKESDDSEESSSENE